jgi:hypothetical protein
MLKLSSIVVRCGSMLTAIIRSVCSERLGAIECYAPTANLDAPTMNLQNVKQKHADQSAEQPLTDSRAWRQFIFKNLCICKGVCAMLQSVLCNFCWSCVCDIGAF